MKKVQILALVTGVITFLLMLTMNRENERPAAAEIERKQVVAASADIQPYTEITDEMLKIIELEEASVHPNAIYEREEVIGMISTTEIFAQEPILTTKIAAKDSAASGLSLQITPGKRGISINTNNETGVAQNLRVGNWVDVLVTLPSDIPEDVLEKYNRWATVFPQFFNLFGESLTNSNSSNNTQQNDTSFAMSFTVNSVPKSYLMLQDIKVIALDMNYVESYDPLAYENGYATVTLEVEPLQALLIHEAQRSDSYGELRLILREQSDHEISEIGGITPEDLADIIEGNSAEEVADIQEISESQEVPTETQGGPR